MSNTEVLPQLPSWLNQRYLENVLRDSEHDDSITLLSYDMSPAVAKGNNFASLIMRCLLKYTQNGRNIEKSVIIKAALDNELLDQFDSMNVEIAAYSRIFPQVHTLLRSIGDDSQLCPKTLVIDKERRTIIFEDLKELHGYGINDRHVGVDMDHVKLVTDTHAKLHACSMVIRECDGEQFEEFRRGLYFEEAELWLEYVRTSFREFSDEVRHWKGYEKYADKLNQMQYFAAEQACQLIKERNEATSVFCHGDCWTANLMFKYENNRPTDLKLIDFQEPIYGSPAFDLYYFCMTSTLDDIKFNRFDEIVQFYHKSLVNYLERLKYTGKTPTLFELQSECFAKSFYGLLTTLVIFTLLMNKEEENADLDMAMGTGEASQNFRKKLFKDERLVKTMKHFLPKWDSQGLLEKLY